jgi:nitrogen fixation protein FixH
MRAARLWPLAVSAVLAVTVGANAVVFYLARDPGAAVVEPDYYRRAVRWDSTLAARRASAALGWTVSAALGPLSTGSRGTELAVRLADRDGRPLAGALVRAVLLHNRDAEHPLTAALVPRGAGLYVARLPLERTGRWEVRLEVVRGAERFGAVLRCEAVADAPDALTALETGR